MKTIAVVSTKGGVGKSTTAVNLGALLADIGKRVLLLDTDIQPTLSSYFSLEHEARGGFYELVAANETRPEQIISQTCIQNLDVIVSNDSLDTLNTMLLTAADGRFRLLNVLPAFEEHYDFVIIDTKGTRCITLEMAILAADIAVSPVNPEMLSAREFRRGTLEIFNDLHNLARWSNATLPPLKLFINKADLVSVDARHITDHLMAHFSKDKEVQILDTIVPALAAYKQAATLGIPAHWHEMRKPAGRRTPSALDTMRALAAELLPEIADEIQAFTPVEKGRLVAASGV